MADLNVNPSLGAGRSTVVIARGVSPELKGEFAFAMANADDDLVVGANSREPASAYSLSLWVNDGPKEPNELSGGGAPTVPSEAPLVRDFMHEKITGRVPGAPLLGFPRASSSEQDAMEALLKNLSSQVSGVSGPQYDQEIDNMTAEGRFEPEVKTLDSAMKFMQVSGPVPTSAANPEDVDVESSFERDLGVMLPDVAATYSTNKVEEFGTYPVIDEQRRLGGYMPDATLVEQKPHVVETGQSRTLLAERTDASGQIVSLNAASFEPEIGMTALVATGQTADDAEQRVDSERVLVAGKSDLSVEAKILVDVSSATPFEKNTAGQLTSPRLEPPRTLGNLDYEPFVAVPNTRGETVAMGGAIGDASGPPARSPLMVPSSFNQTVSITDIDIQGSVRRELYPSRILGQATAGKQELLPKQAVMATMGEFAMRASSPTAVLTSDISIQVDGSTDIKSDQATVSIEKFKGFGAFAATNPQPSLLRQAESDGVTVKPLGVDQVSDDDRHALPKSAASDIDAHVGQTVGLKTASAVPADKDLRSERSSTSSARPHNPTISTSIISDQTYDVREMGPNSVVGVNQTTNMMPVAVAQNVPIAERSLKDTGQVDGDFSISTPISSDIQSNTSRSPDAISRGAVTPLPQEVLKIAEQLRAGARMDRYPLEIALDPPELGQVRMVLQTSEATTTLLIIADRPETAELMRRHANFLHEAFAQEGKGGLNLQFGTSSNTQQDLSKGGGGSSHAALEEIAADMDNNALPAGSSKARGSNLSAPSGLNLTF